MKAKGYIHCLQTRHKACMWLVEEFEISGYASQLSNGVNNKCYTIKCWKTHHCHVFLQKIMPVTFCDLDAATEDEDHTADILGENDDVDAEVNEISNDNPFAEYEDPMAPLRLLHLQQMAINCFIQKQVWSYPCTIQNICKHCTSPMFTY